MGEAGACQRESRLTGARSGAAQPFGLDVQWVMQGTSKGSALRQNRGATEPRFRAENAIGVCMSTIYREILQRFYRARKTIFGLDPPGGMEFSRDIDADLLKYIYPEQFVPHSRSDSERKVRELTQPGFWKWKEFREILIHLGYLGERRYLPAADIPKIIFIDGLVPLIDELTRISNKHRKVEVSRSVFMDRERFCLVQSGNTRIGSDTSVSTDFTPETDRESYQTPIISIHSHPRASESFLFSFKDYIAFLSEPRLIAMVVSNTQDSMLCIKTTATNEKENAESIRKHITTAKEDIEKIWNTMGMQKYEFFLNKAICTEFGLILYQSKKGQKNIMGHIPVAEA
jgi:hypothetical protein